ncbi:hypothetical protein SEPCBS57363_003282 [Sporothrix epigloea]|uniref:Transcription factor TFIIIC triple barrel domain-containing protein n=1 Tax=Sporothrix epigloea TaxID=1892477 RepID=A0ABP0DMD1_9PEZI
MRIDSKDDDDEEWEYEYSTTETETHLISLDLSLPEFVRRRDDMVVHNTRGGFRSWLNPMSLGDNAKNNIKGMGDEQDADADADADNDDGELAEDSDNANDHKHDVRTSVQQQSQKQQPEEPDPTEIQVLELHDAEPLISYRGMLFKGSWSQIIGTEMLFADRSTDRPKDQHPSLSVAPGIELVGATTARIACTPVELRPRDRVSSTVKKLAKPSGDSAAGSLGFVIPVGNAASVPRQQQARFLEHFMALKHQHGESDVVTVQALETKHNAVHGDAEEAKRRARRETLLQVHQERRARRLREAVAAEAAANPNGMPTAAPKRPQPRRRRRQRVEMSPLATVAGDDELAGLVVHEGTSNSRHEVSSRQQDEAGLGSEDESGSEA